MIQRNQRGDILVEILRVYTYSQPAYVMFSSVLHTCGGFISSTYRFIRSAFVFHVWIISSSVWFNYETLVLDNLFCDWLINAMTFVKHVYRIIHYVNADDFLCYRQLCKCRQSGNGCFVLIWSGCHTKLHTNSSSNTLKALVFRTCFVR